MDDVLLKKEETKAGVVAVVMFSEQHIQYGEQNIKFAAGFLFGDDADNPIGTLIGYLHYVDEYYRDIEMAIRDFHSLVKKYGPVL